MNIINKFEKMQIEENGPRKKIHQKKIILDYTKFSYFILGKWTEG